MSEEMDFAQLVAQEDEIKILMARCAELEAENKRLREALTRISETLSDVLDGSRVQEMQVRLGVQQDQLAALKTELKVERMRVVACGAVAMANTPESAARDDSEDGQSDKEQQREYRTVSYLCSTLENICEAAPNQIIAR